MREPVSMSAGTERYGERSRRSRSLNGGFTRVRPPVSHGEAAYSASKHAVKTFTPASGALDTIVDVPRSPSGLGWDGDGQLLIVSMDDRRLLRFCRKRPGRHRTAKQRDEVAPFHCQCLPCFQKG